VTFFCPICWKEISEDDKRCPHCGSDITEHEKRSFEDKLINALKHPERETVQRAVWVLGKIKSVKALEPFKTLFKRTGNPFLKIEILNALSEIATQDAFNLIATALDSKESIVRRKAREIAERRIVDEGKKVEAQRGIMLNKSQRRSLSITLRIVEESLAEMELILNTCDDNNILYERRCDIPRELKDEVLTKVSSAKDRIRIIAEKFNLEKESIEASREAYGKLPYCWKILEDAKAKKLRRYGDVATGLDKALDPDLDIVINLVLYMERLLRNIHK
jgi:HEAT repeat protein